MLLGITYVLYDMVDVDGSTSDRNPAPRARMIARYYEYSSLGAPSGVGVISPYLGHIWPSSFL